MFEKISCIFAWESTLVSKKTANSQSIGADVNEIFFGYYLTKSWSDFENSSTVQTELSLRKNRITPNEVDDQEERAKKMAQVTVEWMKKNGYEGKIVRKWWPKQNSTMITEAVGYQVDLEKNPLDILVKTDKGKFLGLSAKSGKGTGRIPFKNPGLGSIERDLGLKLKKHYKEAEAQMLKEFPNLPKCNTKRKKWFKDNREFYEKNIQKSKFVNYLFVNIRNDIYNKLKTLSNEKIWDYIKNSWMDAGYLKPRYIVVTGRGTNGRYTAEIDDPMELNIKNLGIKKVGWDKIRIFTKGSKLLDMRVKFESTQMATSIKFSGE